MATWEVLQSLSRAAEANPTDPDAWLRLAEALMENGSIEAARHMLVRARGCEPSEEDQWRRLGELGQRLEAQSSLPSAASSMPSETPARLVATKPIPIPAEASVPPTTPQQDSDLTAPRPVRLRRASSVGSDDVTFRGDLNAFTLPDILEFLSTQRSTGSLHLYSGSRFGAVQMARGQVVDVIFPKRPTLLSMLTATRRLSAAELSRVPQAALTDEAALREALVQLGVVDPDTLGRVVWKRIEDGLQELLRWTEGQAEFRISREEVSAEPDGIDTRYLLLSVLKTQDEAASQPVIN